jgi:hypothetical protein
VKKDLHLPGGKVLTLTKKDIDEKVSKHVDKAISTAVKDIKASLPQEAEPLYHRRQI